MKKLIPILLIMAIMAVPAFARNSKMKGENNPILTYKNEDLIHKVWIKTAHGPVLYKVLFEPLKEIQEVDENILSMVRTTFDLVMKQQFKIEELEKRINDLEKKPAQENEYPIFTPDKYNFSNEAE